VLVGTSGTPTGNYGTSIYNVHIGGGGVFDVTGNYFLGQIDEVAIFNKAIPAERILAHFRAGLAGEGGGGGGGDESEFTAIRITGGNIVIEWTGTGTLQSAASIAGPWTDIAGATSPRSEPPSDQAKFFRFKP
jgi:hypothetical protein